MELNEYQEQAMTTCTDTANNFSYMMLNLMGEVGEFSSKVAKAIRKGFVAIGDVEPSDISTNLTTEEIFHGYTKREDEFYTELQKEAGDILWQLSGLCSVMGWKLDDVAQQNLQKLADRQKRNVIVGDGDNR